MAKRARKKQKTTESEQPPEDTTQPIRIPSTEELTRLYREKEKAIQINALLKKHKSEISFPISVTGRVDSGDNVSIGFLYFKALIKFLEEHNIEQIIHKCSWHFVSKIIKILKTYGFEGKFFDDIENKIALEREKAEQLSILKSMYNMLEMESRFDRRVASLIQEREEESEKIVQVATQPPIHPSTSSIPHPF